MYNACFTASLIRFLDESREDSPNKDYTTFPTTFRRRQWHPTPVLLPGKSHGWRNLVGCSPWGREESDTTERLHFHFSLSCIGEGNGNPLWCSCLESPRDGGAWWLPSTGSHRVRHDWSDLAAATAAVHVRDVYYLPDIFYFLNLFIDIVTPKPYCALLI